LIRNGPDITPELVAAHGLKPDEYERFLALIDISQDASAASSRASAAAAIASACRRR